MTLARCLGGRLCLAPAVISAKFILVLWRDLIFQGCIHFPLYKTCTYLVPSRAEGCQTSWVLCTESHPTQEPDQQHSVRAFLRWLEKKSLLYHCVLAAVIHLLLCLPGFLSKRGTHPEFVVHRQLHLMPKLVHSWLQGAQIAPQKKKSYLWCWWDGRGGLQLLRSCARSGEYTDPGYKPYTVVY